MIIYDLKCGDGHQFEGWFQDRAAFEEQRGRALIACPVCGRTDATVIPSSVAFMEKERRLPNKPESGGTSHPQNLKELHEFIHRNFDDVGDKFAEVALRMHRGEEDKRNIKGTTTQNEEESLREEGVQFIKIPLVKFDA